MNKQKTKTKTKGKKTNHPTQNLNPIAIELQFYQQI